MDDMVEFEFRDGKRLVPGYLAAAMDGLETYLMTYKEAIAEANRQMQRNVFSRALDKAIIGHFRGSR
jgi:hypothetical protein